MVIAGCAGIDFLGQGESARPRIQRKAYGAGCVPEACVAGIGAQAQKEAADFLVSGIAFGSGCPGEGFLRRASCMGGQ
ncbi:MAG: hypothetical protein LUE63_04630 [Lachnospiraceae bacterium]|nr:hypothetical protein [Lachnospiraceae bacterium]